MRLRPTYRHPFWDSQLSQPLGPIWLLAVAVPPLFFLWSALGDGPAGVPVGWAVVGTVWLAATAALIRYLRLPVRDPDTR